MIYVQNVTISVSTPKPGIFVSRVVPDTDFARYPAAGYPANNFAKYRVSGGIVNIEFKHKKIEIFSFQQNLTKFLVAISLLLHMMIFLQRCFNFLIPSSSLLGKNIKFWRESNIIFTMILKAIGKKIKWR